MAPENSITRLMDAAKIGGSYEILAMIRDTLNPLRYTEHKVSGNQETSKNNKFSGDSTEMLSFKNEIKNKNIQFGAGNSSGLHGTDNAERTFSTLG